MSHYTKSMQKQRETTITFATIFNYCKTFENGSAPKSYLYFECTNNVFANL